MTSVCFVCLCDVHHIDKRGLCMLMAGGTRDNGQGYPLPLSGRDTRKATPKQIFFIFPSKFFIFSTLPHNIANFPIFFPSERFYLPLCVFPYLCIFSCL